MLEIQRLKSYMISRMRAQGATEDGIKAAKEDGHLPFRPAFKNGKRIHARDTTETCDESAQRTQNDDHP